MKRVKSTAQDEIVLRDELSTAPDKVSALRALAFDGFGKQVHPLLDKWLDHPKFLLRDEAISTLLGIWGHQKYIGKAIEMLHSDSNWSVRGTAATSLAAFAQNFSEGEKYREQITKELLISLINDEDNFVQRDSYNGLLKLVKNEKSDYRGDEFDRNRDVDWKLLQPYLEKYGLSKPV